MGTDEDVGLEALDCGSGHYYVSEGLEQVNSRGVFRKGRFQRRLMAAASLGRLGLALGFIPNTA